MSTNNKPAFPSNISNDPNTLAVGLHQGMSIHQYIATASLVAHRTGNLNEDSEKIAQWAYEDATALLDKYEQKEKL